MNPYTFHISLYDASFFGALFTGVTFILLLWFTGRVNKGANRFLALALLVAVLWIARILAIDIHLVYYVPFLNRLPMQFSLAFGPLIYFYVLKIIRPEYHFRNRDLLHFSPLLLELAAQAIEIGQSIQTGVAPYDTTVFQVLSPALHAMTFASVCVYLYRSRILIQDFYRQQRFIDGDRYRYKLRWLRNLLTRFGLLWLLWIPITVVDYCFYHHHLSVQAYYALYLLLMAMMIYMAVRAHLRAEIGLEADTSPILKQLPPAGVKQKGNWVKRIVKEQRYYEDPELNLSSLAEKLDLNIHELSRIINTALKKNFHDFISEYRVADVVEKMQDPAYDHITLLGIAYDSGFNSKSTFNRIFKEMTGLSPAEYKSRLKKEFPVYKPGRHPGFAAVISINETTPMWSPSKSNRNHMIKNYLKVAWRNLLRNKAHSLINISGLSIGLACSLLILLWVQNELSVDAFYTNGTQLYGVNSYMNFNHKMHGSSGTPGPLAVELKKAFPDIQYATSYAFNNQNTFRAGNKVLKMEGNSAGEDYFKMFSLPLLQGNAQSALKAPESIAISHKMAVAFFGGPEAAIGKTLLYNDKKNLAVTAVFEDQPANVSEHFEYLTAWRVFTDDNTWATEIGNYGPSTFVMLRPDANAVAVGKKIKYFIDHYGKVDRKTANFTVDLGLQPYSERYLHANFDDQGNLSGGRIEYVHLFSIVAVFILLIACINFMNLTTARSVKRAREIGVRKVVGALRSSLIRQFIGESMLITVIAVFIALLLLAGSLPTFNDITHKQIGLPFNQLSFWLGLIAITLLTGLLSGSYPALFLSSFNPVSVLKGTLKLNNNVAIFRKGLVVFQFVLSVVLITGTIVISKQMNYIQNKNLGYDRENLIYVPMEGTLLPKYSLFKQQALQMPGIEAITRITNTPTNIQNGTRGVQWTGKDPNDNTMFTQASVGYDFVKTMKIKVLEGRDFSRDFPTDSVGYLINEAALKKMGYKDPIGQPLTFWGKKGTIIGVMKDFHYNSLHDEIKPMILRAGEKEEYGALLIRTLPGKTREALASLGSLCKQMNPAFPFTYYFSDDEYQKLYQNEQVVSKLSDAFSFLAIFISCLGLLGLAMFTAEQRVKEIGIRKVLGASVRSLFTLLSAEFLILVGIALIIALPIAWYAMNKWFEGYQFHTPIQWWMFGLSGVLIICIAVITVSFQTVKAALVNPVKSLRSE